MYNEMIENVGDNALNKATSCREYRAKFFVSSMLAGCFIGIGVLTSFASASLFYGAGSPYAKLVMAITFCIALTLVIFTNTELFTGSNYVMSIGKLDKKISTSDMISVWCLSWFGNFLGAILLSIIFVLTGLVSEGVLMEFFAKMALAKASIPPVQLFARGILCNFLVCLTLVVTGRAKEDSAKILLTIMCLFAFVIIGFEHSIANMTVFSVALLEKSITSISIGQALYALIIATLGNVVGGAIFVGGTFYFLKK